MQRVELGDRGPSKPAMKKLVIGFRKDGICRDQSSRCNQNEKNALLGFAYEESPDGGQQNTHQGGGNFTLVHILRFSRLQRALQPRPAVASYEMHVGVRRLGPQELTGTGLFAVFRNELMLFAGCFFLIGALDEIAVDIAFVWLKLTGRARTLRIDEAALENERLTGSCAVFIPAWHEEHVIGHTIAHAAKVWQQDDLRLFVGCYRNDPATIRAASAAAATDPRIRVVTLQVYGPTCKADCLNRLYQTLESEECETGVRFRMVVLHDAEDMVDPAELAVFDQALKHASFVQLPVCALPHPRSPWISGHYVDEFAEAHAKTMVVRDRLDGGVPGAGVGCALDRDLLDKLDAHRGGHGPFSAGALTEDYELGLTVIALGLKSRFLRVKTTGGRLIATRAYFPSTVRTAVRQKARWIHGIAFQGWDRLGWQGSATQRWMQLRDRRGPMVAFLLAIAYLLVAIWGVELALSWFGIAALPPIPRDLQALIYANSFVLVWRALARMVFTWREHGVAQAALAIPRILVSNAVAIVAAPRALAGYVRSLLGAPVTWDKTEHSDHPSVAPEKVRPLRAANR